MRPKNDLWHDDAPDEVRALTKQDLFNRAVRGLASQGWQRAAHDVDGPCYYASESTALRCAWGHCDPSITPKDIGTIYMLRHLERGLARWLTTAGYDFAGDLQRTHDMHRDQFMKYYFSAIAAEHKLVWPEDVP